MAATPRSGRDGPSEPAASLSILTEEDWDLVGRQLSLSARQLQIVRLILAGRPLSEAAKEARLAIGTIKTYVQRIYRKLRVADQRELAVVVLTTALRLARAQTPTSETTAAETTLKKS